MSHRALHSPQRLPWLLAIQLGLGTLGASCDPHSSNNPAPSDGGQANSTSDSGIPGEGGTSDEGNDGPGAGGSHQHTENSHSGGSLQESGGADSVDPNGELGGESHSGTGGESHSGTGGESHSGTGGESHSGTGGESHSGAGGNDGNPAPVHSCVAFVDRTAPTSDRTIQWNIDVSLASERCITVLVGQTVVWDGNFSFHPLTGHGGDTQNPIGQAEGPASAHEVTFNTTGTFGFLCDVHVEMRGAVHVIAP